MQTTQLAPISTNPASTIIKASFLEADPEKVLEFATRAAKALKKVINGKQKKIIINGEQFLSFEDWLTVARFYNTTVAIEWTKPITIKEGIFGYEAKATALKDGLIISSAEASCTREEKSWKDKPTFQLRSMCQTRAMAKCLRNVFAWVVVLSGFKTTPAEEIEIEKDPIVQDFVDDMTKANGYNASENFRTWENRDESKITERQEKLLRSLIMEKITDEEEQQNQLNGISELSKYEGSQAIASLIENKF